MKETFVTKIIVKESRNLKNLTIPLSEKERKHLIITGKNGCGKTSLLRDIEKFLTQYLNFNYIDSYFQTGIALKSSKKQLSEFLNLPNREDLEISISHIKTNIANFEQWFQQFGGVELRFRDTEILKDENDSGKYIVAFFDAKRETQLDLPNGIKKVDLQKKYTSQARVNSAFIQYIVNLKADRSFARDENDHVAANEIDEWFNFFEESLRKIIGNPELKLMFDRKNYSFLILEEGKEPYGFNNLSDGYSAIISIITELLLRMEAHGSKNYDLEGIALIDEIETHLHVELQKRIMPFLTSFFPKIQFIVTTHSPFILSSVPNAVICDLETKLITTDLSSYSYDALIESYFASDKYSFEVKLKLNRYEELSLKETLKKNEKEELHFLKDYFSQVPKYLSKELVVKLQQIELSALNKKSEA
jgi:Predicted ATP-binding protein involved in virulence